MKTFKYFLALPLALSAVTACGGNGFSKIDLNAARSITDGYVESIKNSKATNIEVSGHVNKINITGDASWWSYSKAFEDLKLDETLLAYIPNFDVKNAEIRVDDQELSTFSLPSSLTSFIKTAIDSKMPVSAKLPILLLINLPKFPMNTNFLKFFYGYEKLIIKEKEEGSDLATAFRIDWANMKDKAWEKANVNFYRAGSRLKVTLETDDISSFYKEIKERSEDTYKSESKEVEKEEKKFPLSLSITTSKLGYIDSLTVQFKAEGLDYKTKEADIYEASVKGDVDIDLTLNFKQKISKPITIKYQLSYYDEVKDPTQTIPDIVYKLSESDEGTPLKLNKDKSIGLTSSLDDFKEYVTFNWMSNVDGSSIKETEDDPMFHYNYWNENCNAAFTEEDYDVIAIPKYKYNETKKEYEQQYSILGAYPIEQMGGEPINKSYVTTSIDGRVISTNTGLPEGATKILESAGDALTDLQIEEKVGEEKKHVELLADEIYINANMLNTSDSEYIVNIAVAPYLGGIK